MSIARIIAFYLPQYYPTPTNNRWYGEGFTEWTNVRKAKPLFKGHYQPKIPADLGYYDLRHSEVRELQADMAKDAGIEGFCYYHYWFGQGKTELERPLQEVMKFKKPDYPFCLCWANQSWYSKFWSENPRDLPHLIVEQTYNHDDYIQHLYHLIDVFKDPRYIKIEDRLLFMIYRPLEFPDVTTFIKVWRELGKEKGIGDFYFVGQATSEQQALEIRNLGFDGVNISRKDDFLLNWKYNNPFIKYLNKLHRFLGKAPYHYDYNKIKKYLVNKNGIETQENIFPTLIPNWDHSPRSGKRGIIFYNSTPDIFRKHMIDVLDVVKRKKPDYRIVFLKSWNEWGEGNYVEPDLKYGHGYLNVIKELLNGD